MGHIHNISNNLAVVQGQEESCHLKYVYEEFSVGSSYSSLLSDILAAILPSSLFLTWMALNRFNSDKLPYGGVGYLTHARARTPRKMEMDLKTFKDKGLMTTKPGIEKCAGEARRVDYKDFSQLYKLAYIYLQWTKTNDFLLYQPSFEDKESICQCLLSDLSEQTQRIVAPYESLREFLIQFENYRLKLECEKPGPKSSHRTSRTRIDDGQSDECTTGSTNVVLQNPKSGFVAASLYESNNSSNNKDSIESNGISSKKSSLGASDYSPNPLQMAGGNLVSSKEKAATCITAIVEEERRKKSIHPKERYERFKASESLRKKYPEIVHLCNHFAGKFFDMGGKSTQTGICNLFEKSERSEADFLELMKYAGHKTSGKADSEINVRNLDGQANKMPYFMKIIRNAINTGLSVEQLEEQDRRFLEQKELERSRDSYQDPAPDHSVVNDIQETLITEMSVSEALTSSNMDSESSDQDQQYLENTNPISNASYGSAVQCASEDIYALLKTVQDSVLLCSEYSCQYCHCPILLIDNPDQNLAYCVACQPDPAWPSDVVEQIHVILTQALNGDRVDDSPCPPVPALPRVDDADQIALLNDLRALETARIEKEKHRRRSRY